MSYDEIKQKVITQANDYYRVKAYTLISVWSWNFKDGGSLKASFLAKNQHGTKEKSLKKSYE